MSLLSAVVEAEPSSTAARHAQIGRMLAHDVVQKILAADFDVRAEEDLRACPLMEGQDLKALEVSVRVKISPEDLATQMLVRLDQALGLDDVMQQLVPWTVENEVALGDLAIDVAEKMQGCAGDAGALNDELESAICASNRGAQGVACYLIEKLGIGPAFDHLANFARERFAERQAHQERMHA